MIRSMLEPVPAIGPRLARLGRSLAGALAPWLVAAAIGLSATGCEKVDFERVADADVDGARRSGAEQFATALLGAWARNEYPPLGEEATEPMRKAHGPDAQQKADKQLEDEIGSFERLTFRELHRSRPPELEIFRFQAVFDKSRAPVEVRVVHDTAGKVTGFWVKPWQDALR